MEGQMGVEGIFGEKQREVQREREREIKRGRDS